jgi:hydrogenase expression/formation protein HypE
MARIDLSHGSGGRPMHRLIDSLFLKEFSNRILREKKDSAIFKLGEKTLAFTTDSYVVKPLFFPGGDIGRLAVCGTVNDLAVCAARPLLISCGMIIEEGLEERVLKKVVSSMRKASGEAKVDIVTGDTKVVEKGKCDGLYINTSGIGLVDYRHSLSPDRVVPGDVVILSGSVGDHAISILSKREGLALRAGVKSDVSPLSGLISSILAASDRVKFMRDPTRGGLAATLNEIVEGRGCAISLEEERIPVRQGVRAACELLGFDPLYLANEGKVVVVIDRKDADKALRAMRRHPLGKTADIIGRVERSPRGRVYMNTVVGGRRIVDMPSGEQLPRIC